MRIFRTAVEEEFNGIIPKEVETRCLDMIQKMTEAEIRWTTYATEGLDGFTPSSIEVFVQSKANSVCKNLGLPQLYIVDGYNPLQKLLSKYLSGGELETRQNFFEKNSLNYNKGGMEMDI